MNKILLILLFISVSSYADIWKKMFNVERVDSTPQAQYEYGFRVGYNEAINGEPVVVQPSYDAYGKGYVDGRSRAYYDIRRMNGIQMNEQPIIIINSDQQSAFMR